jgi:integrase
MVRVSKFRRANGNWYVRYWMGGNPVDESARTKCESAAERYRIRREIEINAGIQPLKHAEVSQLVGPYLESLPPKTSASHRREARRVLESFLTICGRKRRNGSSRLRTEQLSPATIDRYVGRRQGTQLHAGERVDTLGRRIVRLRAISNVTLRKELRYLSGFFNWCCRQRPPYLRENPIPLSNAPSVKDDSKPHFMITDVEFRALLDACETPRQYLFLLLGWWTGGRRGEILALHYYHFDFDACTLEISHGKNNMYGRLPFSQQIVDIVKKLYEEADEAAFVFPRDPLPSHAFGRLCTTAGVRHHRFHDLRISTSMKIKAGGFDASLAGVWVGNRAATNRAHYTDLTAVAMQIGSLLELRDLPPVPWRTA